MSFATIPTPVVLSRALMLQAIEELCAIDADLAGIVAKFGAPPLWARRPGFATLVRIVLEQQVTLSSAAAAFRRLRAGTGRISASNVSRLSPSRIQRLGITRQKAEFIHGIARAIVAGEVRLQTLGRAADLDAREALCRLRGIGAWTADIYLVMALRRPDVWPDGDLALVRCLKELKRLRADPKPDTVRRITTAWAPWRAVAARIVWHRYLSGRPRPRKARLLPRPSNRGSKD